MKQIKTFILLSLTCVVLLTSCTAKQNSTQTEKPETGSVQTGTPQQLPSIISE